MSLTSIFGYNFTQNLRNIEFSQAKRLSYLLELFCWHILARFKENPRNGFSAKFQKLPKMAFFLTNVRFSRKRAKNLKKCPCYVSYIFYPQLRAKFRKNLRSGFWDNPWHTNGQTDNTDFIGPFRFSTGDQKTWFPKNRPVGVNQQFFYGYAFFLCLFCILKIFENI